MEIFGAHSASVISPKSGGWDQFSTELGCGIVCLSKGITFNWSKFIFEGMISNAINFVCTLDFFKLF